MAEEMAEDAVGGRLAPICVEQYNQDSEKDQKLKELKEESSWMRSEYVEKQGWATMPSEKNLTAKLLKSVQIWLSNSVSRHSLSPHFCRSDSPLMRLRRAAIRMGNCP